MGSIGKRRPSFPLRAMRAGSIDQKDKDNERCIMELRSSEDMSPEESPEMPRRQPEVPAPSAFKSYSLNPRLSNPSADSFSVSEPHLPRSVERFDPSEKYSHYGPKAVEGTGGRRTSHPALPVKDKNTLFPVRDLGNPKTIQKPTNISIPTR